MYRMVGQDTISGGEGTATATINGRIEEMFYIRSLEATVEKQKESFKVLGRRASQNKANGFNGTGSMTIYYVTSTFRKLLEEYASNGKDTYFTITVTNDDNTSSVGKQTTTLLGVNLDSGIVAKLDTEASQLDEEISFTFDDFKISSTFTKPSN